MIPLADLSEIARDLAVDLALGEPLNRSLIELARAYPAHAEHFTAAARHVENGGALSQVLAEWWPETAVRAVKSGETAGTLPAILNELHQTTTHQLRLRKALGRLRVPIVYYLIALAVLGGFLLFLLPSLLESFPPRARQAPFPAFILELRALFERYLTWIVAALGGTVALLIAHLADPRNREAAFQAILSLPLFRAGYREMSFALWARYTALLDGAGLGTLQSLAATAPMLLPTDRAAMERVHRELERGEGLAAAADPTRSPQAAARADDPRLFLPRRITRAMVRAASSGRLDEELRNIADPLHEAGERRFLRTLALLDTLGIVLTATTLAGCLMLYLLLTLSMLRSAL